MNESNVNKIFKELQKNSKGITLVALVVTIVILIILATVSINVVLGEGGLINQAKLAKELASNSTIAEEESMNTLMQEYANIMASKPEIPAPPEEEPTVPEEWDLTKVTPVLSEENIFVPVPFGFTASTIEGEKSINDGFVIKQGWNGAATSGLNEFVWIPVDETSLGEMYQQTPGTALSKYTGVSVTTDVYSKLRGQDGSSGFGGVPGSTIYREPDILISTQNGDAGTQSGGGIAEIKEVFGVSGDNGQVLNQFAKMLVDEYEATYQSIAKYDGFYIGRYEITGNVEAPTVQRDGTVITSENWYNLYKACRNVVTGDGFGGQSTMIYGNQWDEVLDWLVNTGMRSTFVYSNSASWGNYSNSTGAAETNSGSLQTAGKNEAWQANNIYDLAGNYWEYTQESRLTSYRVIRGRKV